MNLRRAYELAFFRVMGYNCRSVVERRLAADDRFRRAIRIYEAAAK